MDLWERAKLFADEAAKCSQELFTQDFVSETAKKSKELAAEAAKRSQELSNGASKIFTQEFVSEATKKADLIADQIRSLAVDTLGSNSAGYGVAVDSKEDFERFGVTEELREFVTGIEIATFRDFPLQDAPEMSEVHTVSNVRQDLNQWQARHATLVLSTVKEISKFRYKLCPRYMKERKFWRIYFVLVDNYVSPYEKKYMEELKTKDEEKQNDAIKQNTAALNAGPKEIKLQTKTSTASTAEQDLDVFLLGDLGSDDDEPDVGDDDFEDDFGKPGSASGLDSDDDIRKRKQST